MDIWLNDEQREFQKFCREFAQKEIKPAAKQMDETGEFYFDNLKKIKENGLCGIYIPKEYGGQGRDMLSYAVAVEEVSKVCATTGVVFSGQQSLFCSPVLVHGTEEQKQRYLTKVASGEWSGAFALTEPGAGTDVQSISTKAELDGDEYVINGSKIFITHAIYADVFIVFAITGSHVNKKGREVKDCTAFLVEKTDPGVSVAIPEHKMGIRASATCGVSFDDCRIPKDRVFGKPGEGFKIALGTLDGGRVGISAQALGICEGVIEEAVRYLKANARKGSLTSTSQNTQFKLADMYAKSQSARGLVYTAAKKKDLGLPYTINAAMAKLYAGEAATEAAAMMMDLCGYDGICNDYSFERMMRDAKITEIYEGTSEVQRMVIAGWLNAQEF